MKNQELSLSTEKYTDLDLNKNRNICVKCGGSGNLKTPENSRVFFGLLIVFLDKKE